MLLCQLRQKIWLVAFFIVTFSYNWGLQYYTLKPIAKILESEKNSIRLGPLLHDFKKRKEQEICFVQRAAALSAAAVIGCFSWPNVDKSFWLAQLAWHISFWLSVSALISSAQQRLLEKLPNGPHDMSDIQVRKTLRLMLKPSSTPTQVTDSGPDRARLEADPKMVWVWQSPLMLMSFSWVTFMVGYELYLLTPLIRQDVWTVGSTVKHSHISPWTPADWPKSAVIAAVVGALVVANLFASSLLAKWAIAEVDKVDQIALLIPAVPLANVAPGFTVEQNVGIQSPKV